MNRQVLIRVSNWIGDCVMSVAAVKELRRLYPDDRLTIVGYPRVTGLFEGQAFCDRVIALGFAGRWAQVRAESRAVRESDRILLFPNSFASALPSFLARVPERLGYRTDGRSVLLTRAVRPRSKRLGYHQAFYFLDLIHLLGLSEVDYLASRDYAPDITLEADEAAIETAEGLLEETRVDRARPLVALNPGAAFGPAKQWFLDRYAALGDLLVEKEGAEIVVVGSRREVPWARQIEERMRARPHCLSGRTSLATLMGLLSQCDLMVTNDSGPMHLAAALGTPLVALFGSTDEIATGPLGHNTVVIHKHVACSPCLLRECPIDLRCFDRIGVEEVFLAAQGLLNSRFQIPNSRT